MTGNSLAKITASLNDGKFHDGTSIGHPVNISRTAVWKLIKKLKNYGIPITAVKGKGYILESPLLLLEKEKIKKLLNTPSVQIDLFEQIESTNDYLKKVGTTKLSICLAETQTKGKGRFQRTWHSPFGQNIYLSLRYSFQKDISELAGLSIVCGLAACHAIETIHLPQPVLIKWPNDIICDHKKLAGILIEIQAETHGFCSAIIGIGVNTNMQTDTSNKITQNWTSIRNLTHTYQDRNPLCAAVINQLIDYINLFESKGFNPFLELWRGKDYLFNKPICLQSGQQKFYGNGQGINEKGNLILKLPDNAQKIFSSGDTTLLK